MEDFGSMFGVFAVILGLSSPVIFALGKRASEPERPPSKWRLHVAQCLIYFGLWLVGTALAGPRGDMFAYCRVIECAESFMPGWVVAAIFAVPLFAQIAISTGLVALFTKVRLREVLVCHLGSALMISASCAALAT